MIAFSLKSPLYQLVIIFVIVVRFFNGHPCTDTVVMIFGISPTKGSARFMVLNQSSSPEAESSPYMNEVVAFTSVWSPFSR